MWFVNKTLVITFKPEVIGLSYCTYVFHMKRPFTMYHNFLPCNLDLEVWHTLEKLYLGCYLVMFADWQASLYSDNSDLQGSVHLVVTFYHQSFQGQHVVPQSLWLQKYVNLIVTVHCCTLIKCHNFYLQLRFQEEKNRWWCASQVMSCPTIYGKEK